MSDGDSNDKENSSTLVSSSDPAPIVPEIHNKIASDEVPTKSEPLLPCDNGDPAGASAGNAAATALAGDPIDIKVVWNKTKYDVAVTPEETVADLKAKMQALTQLPPSMQKIMFKGLCKDDKTMKDLKVTKGTKIMLVGSTLDDVISVSTTPSAKELKDGATGSITQNKKEPLSKQKPHNKVTEKGPPEDVIPGMLLVNEALPAQPLSGMLNKSGGKVRLTFKLESDEVWIGTKERTEKVPMSQIKSVVSEPISGHEQYHMLALQLGPTEASRYWIYWVPAQFIQAIKRTILG